MGKIQKQWKVHPPVSQDALKKFPELPPLVVQLLNNRGLETPQAIDEFLSPDYSRDVHDPYLFKAMAAAVARIFGAAQKHEPVLVYGDYDADGVCATALMVQALEALGIQPQVYIPFREKEGYGINMKAVDEIIAKKIQLVITVDCGVANVAEAAKLKLHGIDLIITDHHNPQKTLPEALAIINPKIEGETYPVIEICGTAVAYKVAQALFSARARKEYGSVMMFPAAGFEKLFLDLVAIGTVTDMMELKGESRTLLKYGLYILNRTHRFGLRQLFEIAKIKLGEVDSHTIGFQIGPRLNAAGRIDHASTSFELLRGTDKISLEAIARDLNAKNQERQKISDRMYQEASADIPAQIFNPVFFSLHDQWSPGLVGLVAGKITEEYYRPTLLIGKNHEGKYVGSGRSVDGFDITAALGACTEHLARFGGHSMACGFTLKDIKNYPEFQKKMLALAHEALKDQELAPELLIDAQCRLPEVTWEVIEAVERFEPFGQGNPPPRLLLVGALVVSIRTVGQKNDHLKIVLGDERGTQRAGIGFGLGAWASQLVPGQPVDAVCEPSVNEWNGHREIQLKIIDLKLSNR